MKKKLKFWLLSLFLLWSLVFLSCSVFAVNIKEAARTTLADNLAARESLAKKQATENLKKAQEGENSEVWLTINSECMWGVGCGLSVYDALWIRKDRAPGERTSVMTFVQDIILGASMFIGTVAAVAFILSGVYYVFSASDASYKKKAQEGMKYAIYGLVLVTLAIVIVRITQFIARGGS